MPGFRACDNASRDVTRMDFILKHLKMHSGRQVLIGTLAITAVSVASPVGVFAVVMAGKNVPAYTYWMVLTICAAIPLLIAPPISIFALSLLRLLTMTIEKVDSYVRLDSLTGVLTRAYLLGQIRERLHEGGCFMMVDADHFKAINDTYGHDVGDEALKKLAGVLIQHVSYDAIIGRLGGEEFGIFLPGARDHEAALAAAQLCDGMRQEGKFIAGHEVSLTVSVGAAVHVDGQPLEKTMKLADMALYHAKRSGRDRFYIADATDTMPALILRSRNT